MATNEELLTRLSDALVKMVDAAEGAGGFVVDQAPMVAQEIVAWELWSGVAWSLVCLLIFAAILFFGTRMVRNIPMFEVAREEMCGFLFAFIGMISIVPLVAFGINLNATIKAAVAPRLVIIDYAKQVVK